MIEIRFEIGGRKVDPNELSDALEAAVLEAVERQIRAKIGSIRHPETGEFPVVMVRGRSLEDLSVEVTGSNELISLISERLDGPTQRPNELPSGNGKVVRSATSDMVVHMENPHPRAFLCHATENKVLAERIAHDLQAAGIETFYAGWEMKAGDSLRQKVDAALGQCTHFVALLTPVSLAKPWVRAEMDGAFVRKLAGACTFIPLRHGLRTDQLPSLLQGYYSPSIEDYETDMAQLISDIYGISRRPPLGEAPAVVQVARRPRTGLSPAATAITQLMVERSQTGDAMDPQLTPDDVRAGTSLTDDDIVDAVDELHGLGLVHPHASLGCGALHFHILTPEAELFVRMDPYWKPWDPEADALRIAADLANGDDTDGIVSKMAERYGWEPRRMNPAVNYLVNRRLAGFGNESGTHPWSRFWIAATPATRRFVRGRS